MIYDYEYHKVHLQKWQKDKLLDLLKRKAIVVDKPYKLTKKELVDILAKNLAEITTIKEAKK